MKSRFSRAILILHELLTGRNILAHLENMNRTQWLDRAQLLALQEAKLQRLVAYAYQYVPYYRRVFDEVGFHPDDLLIDPANIAKVPVLTKDIIRANLQDMLTTEPRRRRRLTSLTTSGSTGHPLSFMQDENFRDHVTADIQRHIGWAGWKLGDSQAFIWGGVKTNFRKRIRGQLIDWGWNRFHLSAYSMSDESMKAFADKIKNQKPGIIFGYASSLHRFARYVRSSPYQGMTFDGIFSSAEMLLPVVRRFIEETFHSPVFNRYGTLELGGVACECETHTGLHVSAENNYVEVLVDLHQADPGVIGEIIVTNLNNFGMPFIRYSTEDEGAWLAEENCPCGRKSRMLSGIEGRKLDSFITPDGRTIWAGFAGAIINPLHDSAIKQFQIVQKTLEHIVIRLVQDGRISQSTLDGITTGISNLFGDEVNVSFEFLNVIPPLPSGKHQYARSELKLPE